MGGKAVQTTPATWPLALVRSIGPPLVAAAVLAVARPPWPQWAAHAFFLVLLVPVAILTVDRVFGGRAALILGAAVLALTGWLAVGPVPTTLIGPLGESAAWVSDSALVQHRWRLPTSVAILEERLGADRACRHPRVPSHSGHGTAGLGVTVMINGAVLPALEREAHRCQGGPWFRTPVTRGQLESSPVTTVEFRREPGNLTAGEVIWGYSYRPTAGKTASRYFDGERWHEVDLAPATPGIQTGRYIVELWLFDRYDWVVMTWY